MFGCKGYLAGDSFMAPTNVYSLCVTETRKTMKHYLFIELNKSFELPLKVVYITKKPYLTSLSYQYDCKIEPSYIVNQILELFSFVSAMNLTIDVDKGLKRAKHSGY